LISAQDSLEIEIWCRILEAFSWDFGTSCRQSWISWLTPQTTMPEQILVSVTEKERKKEREEEEDDDDDVDDDAQQQQQQPGSKRVKELLLYL
jgi:hypothetical protein